MAGDAGLKDSSGGQHRPRGSANGRDGNEIIGGSWGIEQLRLRHGFDWD